MPPHHLIDPVGTLLPAPHRDLTFGTFLFPKSSEGPALLSQARVAEELGYDLIGVPDHPNWGHYLDQWSLMSAIIGHTSRIEVFSAVSSLALRQPPAVLAKAALTLDALAPGRFHLGLGVGAEPGIASIGGPQWTPGESVDRIREAIELTRVFWSGQSTGNYRGAYYQLTEASLPPAPSPGLDIWIGAIKPRLRRLTAHAADGWLPGMLSIDPDVIKPEVDHLDAEIRAAGRPPGSVRRIYNTIAEKLQPESDGLLIGPADQWIDQLTHVALEFGFDTFVFGDRQTTVEHLHRFAEEVIPGVRADVAAAR
ncbi:N5,N10-methylene tetrahydromethanopterin reductase [Acrocarpospora corrugata]|uniref:N5,N10-methylene tetrahydromethanopterin reductase n=1 Tax=Acrocarpospora corrugata TaxID=35763 RepID=A0A5M3W387_9ACTN|nr:LLM class flavin-dependent oxidoreductase [Acrocarpospora corrugata]GES03495.1 N5,N10-methylene tetrahydromethanopterin reductase [Acrocarpospora corrugata]